MSFEKMYDIVVVGGGLSGVAAALEASRSGHQTALVEKTILWGGLATAGMVPIYMPLCDGRGRQVTFGIAEEMISLAVKYGPGRVPAPWGEEPWRESYSCHSLYPRAALDSRFMTVFSPPSFVLGLDEALEASEADLWLDTLATEALMEGEQLRGIRVVNKSGAHTLRARCVVDATGDADIAFMAGAPCEQVGSYPTYLYQQASLAGAERSTRQGLAARLVAWAGIGGRELEDGDVSAGRLYSAVKGRDVSEFVMHCRRIAREKLAAAQEQSGRENLYPAALPFQPQFRRGRRIRGRDTLRTGGKGRPCPDSVGVIADCRETDALWEVPYGALLPQDVHNLLVPGRCLSAEGYAWHVSRLIPAVALSGQIAGIAACLAVSRDTSPVRLEVSDVQRRARERGMTLHI